MKVQQICENLFCRTGQIGYYLLSCRLAQKEEDGQGGAVSAFECHYSAKSGL